jgi:hypothetical protein
MELFHNHNNKRYPNQHHRSTIYALENAMTNLFFSSSVFVIAVELEGLVDKVNVVDMDGSGIVEFHEIKMYYRSLYYYYSTVGPIHRIPATSS